MAEINKTEDQKLEQKLARQKHLRENHKRNTADLVVECLVNEGVEVVFGIPGEENIPLLEAIERDGRIRFVLTRHEQALVLWQQHTLILLENRAYAWQL